MERIAMSGDDERRRIMKIEEEVGYLQRADEELVKQMLEMEKRLREVTKRVERLERGLEKTAEGEREEGREAD